MSFPKITKADQKIITDKWNKYFDEMAVYKPMWLMRIIDPLLIGLCLEIRSDKSRYYPRIFLHNLARRQEDITFDFSLTKSTCIISSVSREDRVTKIMAELKNNSLIPVEGDINYKEFVDNLKLYCKRAYGVEQLSILRILFYLESWMNEGKVEEIEKYSKQILGQGKIITTKSDQDKWIKEEKDRVLSVDELRKNVYYEKQKWNLNTLPHRRFI